MDVRVKSWMSIRHSGTLESKGLQAISLTFSLVESESSPGIPSFPIGLTIIGLVFGVLIITISSKRKLYRKY